ncbi:MAG: hypothetical protein JSU05_09505, partial [Bacteroidetes bacterium]|nr:hypothetical protein [Bacteroidota bacterium]
YMNLPPFPPTIDSNYAIYQKYAQNKYDGQPDLYSLSVAGLSAQFYITKDKKVLFIEKSDLQITPVISGYSIVAFEVKDLNGTKYYFSDLETTKTTYLDGSFTDYSPYNTTSWYLTKVTSPYGKVILTFSYLSGESNQSLVELRSPHQYSIYQTFESGDNTSWSEQYYKRPLLQKISFASGEIDFKMNDSARYDIGSTDHAFESIVVKNYLGDTVKQFHFDYSYFTSTGVIQQGQSSPSTYGNSALRLKLDSLEDLSRANQKLIYKFVYDTTHYLPDRLSSFAMDHWGFFNGQTSNTVWEAKNRVKYYNVSDSFYAEYGTANREPNLEYAKAGVLTKVITPTKGEIRFNYELNSSSDTRLPNTITIANTWYYPTSAFSTNYFSINLINQPFDTIKVQSDVTSSSYSYEYLIEDSLQTQIFYHDTLVVGNAMQQHILLPGKYCIIQKVLGSNPDTSYHYFTRLYKEEETYLSNKPVGGIRIRSMQLFDPVKSTTLQRNYYYNESGDTSTTSLSTGTISNVPQYGHQNIDYFITYGSPGTITLGWWQDNGYTREVSSFYPLGVTAGSFVGYKKVTVVDSNALKTESYFTSFDDFPEMSDGYYSSPLSNEAGSIIYGKWYEQNPIALTDERDFLRGKLTKQEVYKKENGVFSKIQQTENNYQFNMGFPVNEHDIRLPDTMEAITGMLFIYYPPKEGEGDLGAIDLKKYDLYTTRYDLKKTVEKQYTYQGGTDSLVMETNYEYGDSPWYRDSLYHYQPTKISKIVNTGTKLTTMYYPYDWRYGIPDTLSGETNNFKTLDTSNRIAVPVLQVTTDSASGLNIFSVKNTFSPLVNSILAPNLVKTKQGSSASFENRVSFNKYDTSGNLIEQQKTNDIKSVYIWDYHNSYPVAEVINADSAAIAFTSFEAENKGGWSYSGTALDTVVVTGRKAYKLNGSNGLSKSGLTSSDVYILSYWTRNGSAFSVTGTQTGYPISGRSVNGWTYFEHKITGQTSVSLSGTGWVDEVRLYPAS